MTATQRLEDIQKLIVDNGTPRRWTYARAGQVCTVTSSAPGATDAAGDNLAFFLMLLLASPPPPPPPLALPPLPALPSQPNHHRRNCCPCGKCFVRPEFNTPGECSFHGKAAVAVGEPPPPSPSPPANTPTNDSTTPPPPPTASAGRRFQGSVETELLLLGERKCYGKGRAEALLVGATGVRERAPNDYFWWSGSFTEGAVDSATVGGERWITTLKRGRDRRSRPQI